MKCSRRSVGRDSVTKLICFSPAVLQNGVRFPRARADLATIHAGLHHLGVQFSLPGNVAARKKQRLDFWPHAVMPISVRKGPAQNRLASRVPTFLPCPLANAAGFPLASNLKVDLRGW